MDMFIIIPLIIGGLAGWLINYLSDVLPLTRRFSQPVCLHCFNPLPVGTYLSMRKCPSCEKTRLPRAWVVPMLTIFASLLLWYFPHPKLGYAAGYILLVYLAIVFIIDLEYRLIMHPVSIVGAVIGLGIGIYQFGILPCLLGGIGGYAIMQIFYWFGTLFARIRARRMMAAGQDTDDEEALGGGDVVLAGVLGLMLGWPLIWFSLLVGVLLGGLVTIPMLLVMLLVRRYKQDAWMVFIPYGPFFITAAILIIYFPNLLSVLVPK